MIARQSDAVAVTSTPHFKDEILDRIADRANVAQFVSFAPGRSPKRRFARIRGCSPAHRFGNLASAIRALLRQAPEGSVNVRSFHPEKPRSREFLYGLRTAADVEAAVRRLAREGLFTIVNETIDVTDGGVSGVAIGNVVEFAPDDTPRCVEKPGTASLPRTMGVNLLTRIYGFAPALDHGAGTRVEFSLHPLCRGVRHEHTVVWELEKVGAIKLDPTVSWPNRFSRLIGDKAFGLCVADAVGLTVPATTVIPRRPAPFVFGRTTGTGELWIRTCPMEQVPGKFTTARGWMDPFRLLADEDPDGERISSVLAQEGVRALFAGAAITARGGKVIIEGTRGTGEAFMQGAAPVRLPRDARDAVKRAYAIAERHLGPCRFEWVYDGETAWIVQLHRGATQTKGATIYPGEAKRYHKFHVENGLEALRDLVDRIRERSNGVAEGVILLGKIGVTSHLGDILRSARIPSRLEPMPKRGHARRGSR